MRKTSRRSFVRSILAVGTAPLLYTGCVGGFCANRKVNVAIIGCGRISTDFEIPGVLAREDIARIVAVCDIDSRRADFAAERIERYYADGTKVAKYHDYKEVCSQSDDYEMWLGPTDHSVPYNWTRCHSQNLKHIGARPGWIQLAPYGWGMITNWGAHHLDIVRWGLGALGPEAVTGTCQWMDLSGGRLWNVHTNYDLHYTFNSGFTDVHVCDRYQNGVKFVGESGDWLFCTRGAVKITPSDPDPVVRSGDFGPLAASRSSILPKLEPQMASVEQSHIDNFLEAVLASDPTMTVTNAEGGHRSTTVCSLGQMCMKLGRDRKDGFSLAWDPWRETTGNADADLLMKPFANGKFDLKVNLADFGLVFDEVLKG